MNSYNFQSLNDKEFELLAIALLEKEFATRIERFKPGRDQGIDGRFFGERGKSTIIQIKHYEKSGLPTLLKHLEKTETRKVQRLKPERYVFVTSVGLSPKNKAMISSIFAPYISCTADIFGKDDVNALLAKFPDIENRFYKLWLTSTNVLRNLLNNAVVGRSRFKLSEIEGFLPRYVETSAFNLALKKLRDLHTIIITGEPGIGKTTLADHLALHFVAKDYELVFVEHSIKEAEDVWELKKKQVFYFDDFLGRNYLLALQRKEDSSIVGFIKRVKSDKRKRFLLTSRTSILNRGKQLSDLFNIENLNRNEFELHVEDLKLLEKAHILYNHIWFGRLAPSYIEELYFDRRYNEIIKHDNYNPRLISFITDSEKLSSIAATEYWPYIKSVLENPKDIWGEVFNNQIDAIGQTLTCLVVASGGQILEDELKSSFHLLEKEKAGANGPTGMLAFEASLKTATGSILRRELQAVPPHEVSVGLFNPGVGDFIISKFKENSQDYARYLVALHDRDSISNLVSLWRDGLFTENEVIVIFQILLSELDLQDFQNDISYKSFLANCATRLTDKSELVAKRITFWASGFSEYFDCGDNLEDMCGIAIWACQKKLLNPRSPFLKTAILHYIDQSWSQSQFTCVRELLEYVEKAAKTELKARYDEAAIEYVKSNLQSEVDSDGNLSSVTIDCDETGYSYSHSEAELIVQNKAEEMLNDLEVEWDAWALSEYVDSVDLDGLMEPYMTDDNLDDDERRLSGGGGSGSGSEREQIDDLFDRS